MSLTWGCASQALEAKPSGRARTSGRGIHENDESKRAAAYAACYAAAAPKHPGLSVTTTAQFFARDGKYIFVDVELPAAPELASCLRDAILRSKPSLPPGVPAGSVSSGALAIRLGPQSDRPSASPSLTDVRQRIRRVTLEAIQQGALKPDDPVVREFSSPPPPWPNDAQRSQLQTCYATSALAQAGRALHRDVLFLSRDGRVLLADIRVPEAPELARCLLDRIQTWAAPVMSPGETVLSSFLVSLGTEVEEFPAPALDLRTQLGRRDALVARALELKLVSPSDPLLAKLKPL